MTPESAALGARIRAARKAAGISQVEFGRRIRVGLDLIRDVEYGRRDVGPDALRLVADALNAPELLLQPPAAPSEVDVLRNHIAFLTAGADRSPIGEDGPTPGQQWAALISMDEETRLKQLGVLLDAANTVLRLTGRRRP